MQEAETTTTVNNISGKELLTIIERIENVEERIGGLQDDRKCVYAESKSRGFEEPDSQPIGGDVDSKATESKSQL